MNEVERKTMLEIDDKIVAMNKELAQIAKQEGSEAYISIILGLADVCDEISTVAKRTPGWGT